MCAERGMPSRGDFPVRHATLPFYIQHLALHECERTNAATMTRAVLRTDLNRFVYRAFAEWNPLDQWT